MPSTHFAHPPRAIPMTRDYLDTLEKWLSFPDIAFAAWLQHQDDKDYTESTQTVYNCMWRHLLSWMGERGHVFTELTSSQLALFLEENNLYKEHAHRYVRIVERAFAHMISLGFPGANPGSKAAKEEIAIGTNDDTRFLTFGERERVIARIETGIEKIRKAKASKEDWLDARDHALVGAMIGAGLKVGQAQGVTVNCMTDRSDTLDLFFNLPPRRGRAQAHRAKIMPFAHTLLEGWRDLRSSREEKGLYLFPADRERGGPRPKFADAPLHAVSVFRRTKAVLAACGVTGERACAQTLRNTYAALLIDVGATDADLIVNLGLAKSSPDNNHMRSVDRLRAAYKKWIAVQLKRDANV
jgi:integrase